jgi:signal transduction histidine kinase/CheY-like chemotaxis protein
MLRILLVEDNPGDVVLVKEMLKLAELSFEFTHVTTVQDTLDIYAGNQYDVILLDLGLPDSIGLETLKRILAFNAKSPLIVMTGLDDEDIALASLREGAQDYLVKNRLTPDIILRSIKYSIERKKIQDMQKLYAQRFSILSASAAALNEGEDIPSMFRIICSNLTMLVPEAHALAFDFPAENSIRVSGIDWMTSWLEQINNLEGYDLNSPVFALEKKSIDKLQSLSQPKLARIDKAIADLCSGFTDPIICEKLEELYNSRFVYAIGLNQQSVFYGGFIIFTKIMISSEDENIIEAINNQTALNIHRRSIENDLRISEDRYRMLTRELEEKVRKRTRDLEQLNAQLNKELTERIQIENALKQNEHQLKELNATKDKFFNIVAHDLKNPFTSLLGSSELLFQNIEHLDMDHIRKLAIILNDSAKSGYSILQNLLDWSRSQTGMLKYNPEKVNLRLLIEENIANFELFAVNKEIMVTSLVKHDLFMYTDKNMINTILRNLISNAIKFSYRLGRVIIKATMVPHEVIISVKDHGAGIPEGNIDGIFRIDSKFTTPGTENEQGTGLGLKLCKEFIEKLGGRLWVVSKLQKGTEFSFSLTLKESLHTFNTLDDGKY